MPNSRAKRVRSDPEDQPADRAGVGVPITSGEAEPLITGAPTTPPSITVADAIEPPATVDPQQGAETEPHALHAGAQAGSGQQS